MRKAHATTSLARIAIIAIAFLAFAAVLEASDNSTVNYNTNQSITAHTVCKKVTNSSGTGLNVYVPTQSAAEWPSFYSNPPSGITIGSCATNITIPSGANLNLCTLAGNPTTPSTYIFTIPAGAVISSNSTGIPALTTGSCWPAGSTVTLINNGSIYGRGGNGGSKRAGVTSSDPGSSGGDALSLAWPLSINTNGFIFGGGGGGGAGGAWKYSVLSVGCGGGGGQGVSNSSPGSGPCATSPTGGTEAGPGSGAISNGTYVASGGSGGAWAAPGGAGATYGGSGGGGGAAGKAITGASYGVTWLGGNNGSQVRGAVQ